MAARRRNLIWFADLEPRITRLGDKAVPALLDIVEELAAGADGAGHFASSCVFLIPRCARIINDAAVERMQRILARRVEIDRVRPIASILGENLARVLHELRPGRFPRSILNPRTNHLDNPEPFMSSSTSDPSRT